MANWRAWQRPQRKMRMDELDHWDNDSNARQKCNAQIRKPQNDLQEISIEEANVMLLILCTYLMHLMSQ